MGAVLVIASVGAAAGEPSVASDKPGCPAGATRSTAGTRCPPKSGNASWLSCRRSAPGRSASASGATTNCRPVKSRRCVRATRSSPSFRRKGRRSFARVCATSASCPESRRQLVRREIGQLRSLPEPQRAARMNSEELRSQFSPRERVTLGCQDFFPGQLESRGPARYTPLRFIGPIKNFLLVLRRPGGMSSQYLGIQKSAAFIIITLR